MTKTKVLFGSLLMAVVCAVGLLFGRMKVSADSNWYEKAMEKYKDKYSYSKLVDLNGDGTEELLLSNEAGPNFTYEGEVLLLACQDGEAKEVETFNYAGGFRLCFNKDENRLAWVTRLSGEQITDIYVLNEGVLDKEYRVEKFQAHHDPNRDCKETTYYVNSKMVTEKEYNEYVTKYFADDFNLELTAF